MKKDIYMERTSQAEEIKIYNEFKRTKVKFSTVSKEVKKLIKEKKYDNAKSKIDDLDKLIDDMDKLVTELPNHTVSKVLGGVAAIIYFMSGTVLTLESISNDLKTKYQDNLDPEEYQFLKQNKEELDKFLESIREERDSQGALAIGTGVGLSALAISLIKTYKDKCKKQLKRSKKSLERLKKYLDKMKTVDEEVKESLCDTINIVHEAAQNGTIDEYEFDMLLDHILY